jgi:hypothetical protein
VCIALVGCGKANPISSTSSSPSTALSRPSSPARLSILSPRNGQVIHGSTVPVRLKLKDAKVVKPVSTHITGRKGHIHIRLDGKIISMNYGLNETIHKVSPGTHTLQVEFVASDHLPFDPRVLKEVAFEVKR